MDFYFQVLAFATAEAFNYSDETETLVTLPNETDDDLEDLSIDSMQEPAEKTKPIEKSGKNVQAANVTSIREESFKPAVSGNATYKPPANATESSEENIADLMPENNTSTDKPVTEKSSSNMFSLSFILAVLSLLCCFL